MAEYNFKKLSEVEALTEVPEGANAFIEVNGEIKRVSGDGLGGGAGIKTAIIKSSDYDNALAGVQAVATLAVTYECINMTFEEAYETMAMGEPLSCVLMIVREVCISCQGACHFTGSSVFGVPCIVVGGEISNTTLFWTADGLSTEEPSSGE